MGNALESLPEKIQGIINSHVGKWTRYRAGKAIESDLEAAGIEGYFEALAGYQPALGPLGAYATPFIKGAVVREAGRHLYPILSEDDFLNRPQVLKAVQELLQKSLDATVETVAERSGLPPQQVERILNPSRLCSLTSKANDDHHHLEPAANDLTDVLAVQTDTDLLTSVLDEAGLDPFEFFIFADVLGWPMGEEKLSYEKVGRRLGVSSESVRRRLGRAKQKIESVLSTTFHH